MNSEPAFLHRTIFFGGEYAAFIYSKKAECACAREKSTSEAFRHLNMVSLADQCSNSDQSVCSAKTRMAVHLRA